MGVGQVVESGGLSAAETVLDVNLPTISAHLAALEAQRGMRLCERGRRGFRLTEQGRGVLAASERLFQSIDAFRAEVDAVSGKVAGSLRLGLADNTITDPDFEHLPLYAERLSLYAGRGHRLFAKKRVGLQDLAGAECVMRGYLRESQAARGRVWSRRLPEDVGAVRDAGISAVLTLLNDAELARLGVPALGMALREAGLDWTQWPLTDFGVPDARAQRGWDAVQAGLLERVRAARPGTIETEAQRRFVLGARPPRAGG